MAIVHFVNYKKGTQSRAAMRGVMLYVMQEKKTTWEGEPLVSGINCQPQSVYDDFLNTKLLYHKDGGVETLFRDSTAKWEGDDLTRQRAMLVGGTCFLVTSVFPGGASATPTDKLLRLIDTKLEREHHEQ